MHAVTWRDMLLQCVLHTVIYCYTLSFDIRDYDIVLHAVTLCYMLLPVLLMLHLVTYHKRL